jgi:hypothetical protein
MHDRTFIGLGITASVLILSYFLFILVRRILRSRLMSTDETKDTGPAFTLPALKQMLEKGVISPTEFERIKKTIIDNVRTSDDGKGR